MTSPPAGLPLLGVGIHLNPEDGACLMEYVSVLAGERFTDAPPCTDPLLATLARLVNDATSDGGRDRLGTLAPALATAPRTDAVGAAALVLSTVLSVHAAVGRSRRLDRHLCRARLRQQRTTTHDGGNRWARWLEVAHRRGAGRRRLIAAVDATASLPAAVRDAVLFDALASGLALLRDRGQSAPVSRVRWRDPALPAA